MAKPVRKQTSDKLFYRTNDAIRHSEVRIVGDGIESRVVSLREAKSIAESMGLDLIEINSNAKVPVVRIADYEKMLYEQKKALKKNKQHIKQLKEVQLSVSIAKHDLETKANQAKRFINDGSKVKVVLSMKGRELTRRDENKKSLLEFINLMDEVAIPEAMPKDEGNKTVVILKKRG